MSQGGSKPTTSQTSSTTPWAPMQNYLQHAASKANDWANNPANSAIYAGTTVIPFSQNTLRGMDQATGIAENAMTPMQNPLKSYTGMFDVLNPIARGDFSNDTTFGSTLQAAQEAASTSVNDAMSSAGRYGSGVHQSTMGKTIGDMTNQAMLDRQNWALGGIQSLGDRMPGAYNTALAPGQTMMGVGGMQEDLAGKYAQEGLDKFNAAKQAPIDAIAQSNAIFTGSGSLGSNQTQKIYQPTQWGQVGANAAGAALAGK
jgi:hypothetical protein